MLARAGRALDWRGPFGHIGRMALPIDHLVLPVGDLAVARKRLSALGFCVAPDGIHPFGTANCCVFIGDGTYLEPLAIHDPTSYAAACTAGNVFVARDEAYRAHCGPEGFSALALRSASAEADHRRFKTLAFRRVPCWNLRGRSPILRVDRHGDVPSCLCRRPASLCACLFACERVRAPDVDRAALERHPNGVGGIRRICLVAGRPVSYIPLFELVLGAAAEEREGDVAFDVAGATLSIGRSVLPEATLSFEGLTFGVADLDPLMDLLDRRRHSAH